MADFERAYLKTSKFEGGYSNHPNDRGGETYKGIARNMWKQWGGWKIIDRYKTSPLSSQKMTQVLAGSVELEDMVEAFYRAHFWKPIWGDDIMNQLVAENIYDFAVNSGVSRAIKYAQRVVGASEDGVMGSKTIKAINAFKSRKVVVEVEGLFVEVEKDFVQLYKGERMQFIKKIIARDESQGVFLKGWTNRVQNA